MSALTAHLAVLLAFAYASTGEVTIGEPQAAIAVEIVAATPSHALTSMPAPDTSNDQGSTLAIAERQDGTTAEPLAETHSAFAAFAAPVPAVTPMPLTRSRRSAAKTTHHQTSSPKPQRALLVTEATPEATDSLVSSQDGGATGISGAATASSEVVSAWKASLLSHLARYKRYPDAARARHAEGTALLSFGMDRDGRVLGYYLVRSSGSPELDDEVLAMIVRASPLPPVPRDIREQIVQLVVPVRFSL